MKLFLINLWIFSLACVHLFAQETISGYIPTSGGAQLYYEVRGEGEPIVLLHGHSLDTRMWDKQFRAFSKNHKVVRLDFRGYGRSSEQTETFQFTHMDDVLTVMDSLKIERAHIVGLSMGAFVASDMLAIHPERMFSCVLASGSMKTYKGPSEPMDEAEKAKRDKEIAALKEKGIEKMKAEWLDNLVASGGSHREKIRKPLKRMIDDWTAWQPLHKEVRVIVAHDAEVVFKATKPTVPTLMIDSSIEKNEATANNNARHPWMLDFLPNGEHFVLPDCGHMMNMEQPKAFNAKVLEFISNHQANK